MVTLKAVSNTPTHRILICTIRSQYSDQEIPLRVRFNAKEVVLQPNLDGLEWILNKDRSSFLDEIKDLVFNWSE